MKISKRYCELKIITITILLLVKPFNLFAQDKAYVQKLTQQLSSKKFWGRGYTKQGMYKASQYLEKEYKKLNLLPLFGDQYLQAFSFPVNTFPKQVQFSLSGKSLQAGRDFIIKSNSAGKNNQGLLKQVDSLTWKNAQNGLTLTKVNKLTWSVARTAIPEMNIQVLNPISLASELKYKLKVDQKLNPAFKAYNVGAYVKGTQYPDKYLVITAHYDHLGGMGKRTYFSGANDNASGVAFMLSLAKYYSENPAAYSIVFLAFGAEEAGILGSKYYTENPAFDMEKIAFVFNFDLMGNGDEGATIVNGAVFPEIFERLKNINEKGKFLKTINPRGKAANSDHYYFSEKGVPAFFMYTQGGGPAYHDINDRAGNLKFPVYEKIFELIKQFNTDLMRL